MKEAAKNLEFEEAAKYRDRISICETNSVIDHTDFTDSSQDMGMKHAADHSPSNS